MIIVTRGSVAVVPVTACAAPGPSARAPARRPVENGRGEEHQEDQRREEQRVPPLCVDLDERVSPTERVFELLAGLRRDGDRGDAGQGEQQDPHPELLAPDGAGHHEQRADRGQRQQHDHRVHDEGVSGDAVHGEHAAIEA